MEYPSCQHIEQYLVPGKRCHLVGIGGVSMRPLGLVLRRMGMEISGSDMNASVSTDELIAKGIQVSIGHRAENIEGADCLIRTAAAHNDNPEIAAARARGIPIFERAQAWGYIMRAYKNAICVSGTHGKTTTTSMLTHIFMQANRDPTIMIGGFLPLLGAGIARRQGRHDHSRKLRILQFVPELLPDRCGHSRRGRRSSGLFQGSSGRGAVVPEICLPRPGRRSDRRQRR
ncbi:MAG: Mur ligase domain-containing protein [Oscillospiraceae bacterium]